MTHYLDLDSFSETPVTKTPFNYLVLPNFIHKHNAEQIEADFPLISERGSFPLSAVNGGAAFNRFIEELFSSEVKQAFEEKYQINLSQAFPTITIRGQTTMRDGYVHTDSTSKILTVLIYFNSNWDDTKGRLRLLNSNDLNDIHLEVLPAAGTLISFLNSPNAWHGHLPFVGERKAIQFNWVTSESAAGWVNFRHRVSAKIKSIFA